MAWSQTREMIPGTFSPCLGPRLNPPQPGDPGLGRPLPGLATPQDLLRNPGLDLIIHLKRARGC